MRLQERRHIDWDHCDLALAKSKLMNEAGWGVELQERLCGVCARVCDRLHSAIIASSQ